MHPHPLGTAGNLTFMAQRLRLVPGFEPPASQAQAIQLQVMAAE
jgi:hypothetical protein